MSLYVIFFPILLLMILITCGKVNAFLSFLIVAIIAGFLFKLSASEIVEAIHTGIGETLGSLVTVICLGAMLGKIVAASGAAEKISSVLMAIFGPRYIQWALMVTGFIIGIPLFYGVGFVLMVPLIFAVVQQYKLPAVYIGLPMLAALSVTHGFLPPHPAPSALVLQFHANSGTTLLYGLVVAVPSVIIAGPVFARFVKHIPSSPLQIFMPTPTAKNKLPGTANSFITALFPVALIIITTAFPHLINGTSRLKNFISFIGEPTIVLLIAVLVATFTLGVAQQKKMNEIMDLYTSAVKDVAMILLIIAGAGALKQIMQLSGVSNQLAFLFLSQPVHPLILGWLMAAIIRLFIGSATIAGLITAGIIAPLIIKMNVDSNLMVLAVGAGSLMCSHVNDAGFWMFKEYFNLSVKNTLKTWTVMESIVSVTGLAGVLLLNFLLKTYH